MELFRNYKHYIVIIIITVVLGYFLGITVSTVVDYRLKDVIVNLPKPKNKITVQLGDEKIQSEIVRHRKKNYKKTIEKFKGSGKKTKGKKNKKISIEKLKNIDKDTTKTRDPNMEAYAKNFSNSEKNKSTNIPYKAFNEELANSQYQDIE